MRTVHVQLDLAAPIDKVFALLANHGGYGRFPGVRKAMRVQAGAADADGVGAVREITLSDGAWFREEITAFEPPHRLGYRILKSRPPLEHPGGEIVLTPTEGGCRAAWTSTFRVTVPIIGGLLTWLAAGKLERGFTAVLKTAAKLAAE